MKCNKCTQRPELIQTGFGPPAADLYCPVCYTVFWSHDGKVSEERPASAPPKKVAKNEKWEIKGGQWITA